MQPSVISPDLYSVIRARAQEVNPGAVWHPVWRPATWGKPMIDNSNKRERSCRVHPKSRGADAACHCGFS